ncbi:MAG: hypothetical protein HZA94_01535 [Candidatus Vogelbacteria bacterium]|nr:hypothetical protein [Candidatus Vogelbacteria bacterium]
MINQDVLAYIGNELGRGTAKEIIRKNLISGGGWTNADVDFHFGIIGNTSTPKVVPRRVPEVIVTKEAIKPTEVADRIMIRTGATDNPNNLQNMASLMTHSLNTETNLMPTTPKPGENPIPEELKSFILAPATLEHKNMAPEPFPAETIKPKGSPLKILIILIFMLLLGGSGAYGYYYYVNNQSDEIIAKTIDNLANIKSFEYQSEFSFGTDNIKQDSSSNAITPMNGTFTLKQNGIFDGSDPSNVLSAQDTTITLESSLHKGSLVLNTMLLNRSFYIKAAGLPDSLSPYVDLDKINNIWVSIDTVTMEDAEDMYVSPEVNTAIAQIDQQKLDRIREGLNLHPIFRTSKNLGEDEINGIKTYHYATTLDKENAKALILILIQPEQGSPMTGEEAAAVEKTLTESIDALDEMSGEVWIGKNDYLPYKITGSIVMDMAKIKSSAIKNTGKVVMGTSANLSKFNQKFDLVAPTETTPIRELMDNIFTRSVSTEAGPSI